MSFKGTAAFTGSCYYTTKNLKHCPRLGFFKNN
nr:MAG TPA: hypothetical protein [Caudoviricetes sp.]